MDAGGEVDGRRVHGADGSARARAARARAARAGPAETAVVLRPDGLAIRGARFADGLSGHTTGRQRPRRYATDLPAVGPTRREGDLDPVAGRERDPVAGVGERLFVLDRRL